MRVFAFVLACFAFPGHARRVQMKASNAPSEFEGRADTSSRKFQSNGNALAKLLLASNPAAGFQLGVHAPTRNKLVGNRIASNTAIASRTTAPLMEAIDSNSIYTVAALLGGAGVGALLIFLTEQAGVTNEEYENDQPCVECGGKCVERCSLCRGTGVNEFSDKIRQMQKETGQIAVSSNVVTVEDWAEGPQQVMLFEEIFKDYPPKVTENICYACDGRGVVVCENCEGTGIQPRFLERFSPDDFMD
mmetsp:Transcript_127876/g.232774  ORF Transcript_127876/g.232774 Transcript_127876/m.232774 type:complete len:247 (+) Transcript_127876:73-813(+)